MENKEPQHYLSKIPLSLRFVIKSVSFTAHHTYLLPSIPDNLDFTQWFHFIIGSLTYIGLLSLLVRVTVLILTETCNYFNREGLTRAALIQYLRYGLDK